MRALSWLTAAIYDRFMRSTERASLGAWRSALLGDLRGKVLEVGAGTGANLGFYPAGVEEIVLAEPDPDMRVRLLRRVEASGDARISGHDASLDALPWPDGTFDAVVGTLVLCTVDDPARALAEVRRVLAPDGRFVFLEHVAADHDPARLEWQRRIEPFWRPIAGGCRLTRRTSETIRAAGFDVREETRESARKALPIVRTMIRGVAYRT